MERADLLGVNGGIFKPQGEAIAAHAASSVRILVVGFESRSESQRNRFEGCLAPRTAPAGR
jgi:hypothetical protein